MVKSLRLKSTSTWFAPSVVIGLLFLVVVFTDNTRSTDFLLYLPTLLGRDLTDKLGPGPVGVWLGFVMFFIGFGGLDVIAFVTFAVTFIASVIMAVTSSEPRSIFRYRFVLFNLLVLGIGLQAANIFVTLDFYNHYAGRMRLVEEIKAGRYLISEFPQSYYGNTRLLRVCIPVGREKYSSDQIVSATDRARLPKANTSPSLHVHFTVYKGGHLQYCADDVPDLGENDRLLKVFKLQKDWYWVDLLPESPL
ncbi:MAG: hypothetical protein JST01_14270 [Cyanobacteria bacterium SZAS TMP-1]|nr:hypothetical protein [Cyanobacteria bacterium SZAS TMP-1]